MKKGCADGCMHCKEVKVTEMSNTYAFRCTALNKYMKEADKKKKCRFYSLPYRIKKLSIEDFLDE